MKKIWDWYYGKASIRKKLIISYLILVILPILVLGMYSYYVSKKNLIRQTKHTMESNVDAISYSLQNDIQRETDNIKYLSYNAKLRGSLENGLKNRNALVKEMNDSVEPTFWYFIASDDKIKGIEIYSPSFLFFLQKLQKFSVKNQILQFAQSGHADFAHCALFACVNLIAHGVEHIMDALAQLVGGVVIDALGVQIVQLHGLAIIDMRDMEGADLAVDIHRQQGHAGAQGDDGRAAFHLLHHFGLVAGALGEDAQDVAFLERLHALAHGGHIGGMAGHQNHMQAGEQPAFQPAVRQLALADEADLVPFHLDGQRHGVGEAAVIGHDDIGRLHFLHDLRVMKAQGEDGVKQKAKDDARQGIDGCALTLGRGFRCVILHALPPQYPGLPARFAQNSYWCYPPPARPEPGAGDPPRGSYPDGRGR